MNTTCRLCLKVDVQVYKLDKTHHVGFIENIFKLKQFPCVPSKSYYVCYICMALLSKTSNFIQMIWNAQKLIYELLKSTGPVTKPMLKNIDRQKHGLDLISLNSIAIVDKSEFVYDSYQDSKLNMNKMNEKTQIKKEVDIINEREVLRQDKEFKNTCYIQEIGNITFTDCIEVYDSSDANIEEPIAYKCYGHDDKKESENTLIDCNINYVEIEMHDPLAVDINKSENRNTLDVDINAFDGPKSVSLKRFNKSPDSRYFTKTESSSSSEEERRHENKNKEDEDYKPDSTSHSEDSNYDSYDDTGKRIKRPDREYPRKCDHCDYEVPKKCEHYRHYQFDHPNTEYPYAGKKIYPCSICGKLMTKTRVAHHERTHIVRRIKCIECPKVFTNTKRMHEHRATVHPRQTYTCDYCSKTFKTRNDIMRHLRTHTGEKPFKCHICGAGFAHSGNRSIHIRSAHQNFKYVPKKRKPTQKVRKNKKYDVTDTEIESSDEENIYKKRIKHHKMRNTKKGNHPNAEVASKNKATKRTKKTRKNVQEARRSRKDDHNDAEMKSNHEKQSPKDKNNTQKYVCKSQDDGISVESDSEDETLAQKKKKKIARMYIKTKSKENLK